MVISQCCKNNVIQIGSNNIEANLQNTICIGHRMLKNMNGMNCHNSILIGDLSSGSGNYNITIGYEAKGGNDTDGYSSGSNNINIGYKSGYGLSEDNKLRIGNSVSLIEGTMGTLPDGSTGIEPATVKINANEFHLGDTLPTSYDSINQGNKQTQIWKDPDTGFLIQGEKISSLTFVDPNDLQDDAARDKITYGDRRFNWFFKDEFFAWHMDKNITKIFNGIRTGSLENEDDTRMTNIPNIIKNSGFFTMYPMNGIYYKFRGLYWVDKYLSRLPSPGILGMNDARFAAFGYKNGKWYWLGTCSMNNTDIDINNIIDPTIPTVSITEEGTGFSYGNSGGYPKKWQWSHNIDFYKKYRIKHIKLGTLTTSNNTNFQNCDDIHEIEFF